MNTKTYRRDCVFGALGALFMLAGDLCLSIVPASEGDSGLFAREAYLNGGFQPWRLPLLLATGLIGMALGFFTVRAFYSQIDEKFKKTRMALLIGGVVYVASAGVLHFFIGSLADWTGKLTPILGREDTCYDRRAIHKTYAGNVHLIRGNVFVCAHELLRRGDKENSSAAEDDFVPYARVAACACADSRHTTAARCRTAWCRHIHVGFRRQPKLGQRFTVHMADCERCLGGKTKEQYGGQLIWLKK